MIEHWQEHGGISIRLQQVLSKQSLVQCRGNLSYKNGIVTILIRLIGTGEERVHRMAKFMSQRIHAISFVVEVQQNKRARIVCSATVGSTTFTRRLIDIDPALCEGFLQVVNIVLSQRG